MEEISGCDSASSNAIQARLACPRQFLTPSTQAVGLGRPHPDMFPSCMEGTGEAGIPATVHGLEQRDVALARRLAGQQVNPCACLLLSLQGAPLSGCSADGLAEASLALSCH